MSTITFKVEFGGGLELLFGNERVHSISLPSLVSSDNPVSPLSFSPTPKSHILAKTPDVAPSSHQEKPNGLNSNQGEGQMKKLDIQYLMFYLRDRVLRERPELFMDRDGL